MHLISLRKWMYRVRTFSTSQRFSYTAPESEVMTDELMLIMLSWELQQHSFASLNRKPFQERECDKSEPCNWELYIECDVISCVGWGRRFGMQSEESVLNF